MESGKTKQVLGQGVWWGLAVLGAGVGMQAAVWYFPVQRAMGGRGDWDLAILLTQHLMVVMLVGLLVWRVLWEPEARLTGVGLVGWVLNVGAVVGMMVTMGVLGQLQEQGRFEWESGYRWMCAAGVMGAGVLGLFWMLLRGRRVLVMGCVSAGVSLVGLVGMCWWMRPYFYGAESGYRHVIYGQDVSIRLLTGACLMLMSLVMLVRWAAAAGQRGRGEEARVYVADRSRDLEETTQGMYWAMFVPEGGVVVCIVLSLMSGGSMVLAFGLLGFVAMHIGLGVWVLVWAFKNRMKVMPDSMNEAFLWRYHWAAASAGLCATGVAVVLLSAVFYWHRFYWYHSMGVLLPLVLFMIFVGFVLLFLRFWRRLKGRAVFEYLWPMALGELMFVILIGWIAGGGRRYYYQNDEDWIMAGVLVLLFVPGAVAAVARARIEHERPVLDGGPAEFCVKCGYNLKGTLEAGLGECPECGAGIRGEDRV